MEFRLTLIILLFCNPVFGQIKIDMEKLRLQLKGTPASSSKPNSSYCNYYKLASCDTMWFQGNSSVIGCLTTASVSPYYNKCAFWFDGKPAEGEAEIVFNNAGGYRKIYSGTLKSGHYDSGKFEIMANSCQFYSGQFWNGRKTGFWIERSETGNIIAVEEYDERLEFPVRKWQYGENGGLLSFTDESEFLEN